MRADRRRVLRVLVVRDARPRPASPGRGNLGDAIDQRYGDQPALPRSIPADRRRLRGTHRRGGAAVGQRSRGVPARRRRGVFRRHLPRDADFQCADEPDAGTAWPRRPARRDLLAALCCGLDGVEPRSHRRRARRRHIAYPCISNDLNGASGMCRSIKTLFNFEPPATDEEIYAASLQFVRKISGFNKPAKQNEVAFNRAVVQIAATARSLLDTLETSAEPRDREVEAARARARAAERFGTP